MTQGPDVGVAGIGAGVVGLACAAALARRGASVVIIERHGQIATETTSRNSQVVHAGIYNPEGSLKSTLCVEGRHVLVERCARWKVPYRKVGKLIVAAVEEDIPRLEELLTRGRANGVEGLRQLTGAHARKREPDLRAAAAVESVETGIIDAVAYARSFLTEAEELGATVAFGEEVLAIEPAAGGYCLRTRSAEGDETELCSAAVVNAAGLCADQVAAAVGIDVDACGYRLHFCKGDYFSLLPEAPLRFRQLIYPLPERAGLGVHATLDLDGRIRFGPDTEYVSDGSLRVDPDKAERFAEAIRYYAPKMRASWLAPEYAGIRPKLAGPGEAFRDFVIAEESAKGLPGFVNLIGIESPGLTASSAIAERVADLLPGIGSP